jgi:rhodanese-related sulfurtransferase
MIGYNTDMNSIHNIISATFAAILLAMVAGNVRAMSVEEFLVRTGNDRGVTVIDIRAQALFAQSHIPNAINIPASVLERKRLPPLGSVVVYGDGIDEAALQRSLDLLNSKRGIQAEGLDGGFAAWLSSQSVSQEKQGIELASSHDLTFQQLETLAKTDPSLVLVDMRTLDNRISLRDVFGDVSVLKVGLNTRGQGNVYASVARAILRQSTARSSKLFVLVDDGDGSARDVVHRLHAASLKRVAVLTGGELALRSRGQVTEEVKVFEN